MPSYWRPNDSGSARPPTPTRPPWGGGGGGTSAVDPILAQPALSPGRPWRRRAALAAAGLAALVFSSHAAFALSQCAMNAPNGVLAEAGQTCNVSGTYATSANNQILGQATGLGALITGPGEEGTISFTTSGSFSNALQADTGGAITLTPTADNPGTVTTTGNNSIGLYATGSASGEGGTVASSITVQNLNITTQGNFANGVQADTGGVVTLNGGSVAVTGTGSLGLFATGTGSQINATDVTVSTAGSGLSTANAIDADSGAVVTVTGGSASTTGTDAFVAGSTSGGTLNLSGTTITATGAGSGGLYANGTGSTVTGTGLTITTHGNYDSENNFGATGISNQSYGEISGGGFVTLTSSSILTMGTQATGVSTANGAPEKPAPPRLSMVVLPFANIGGDPEQEHFVDGVTESLTTDLSRIRSAVVIARNTAFAYKGKPLDVKTIGRELNVRYVLEGSVQRAGNRMRVNVQLIDAENGQSSLGRAVR